MHTRFFGTPADQISSWSSTRKDPLAYPGTGRVQGCTGACFVRFCLGASTHARRSEEMLEMQISST
jgi:hypothetical protein